MSSDVEDTEKYLEKASRENNTEAESGEPVSSSDDVASQASKTEEDRTQRPQFSRENTAISTASRALPALKRKETKLAQKEAHPWQHLGITLGLPMIVLFDIVVPIIIYYTWYDSHKKDWQRSCREQFPGQNPCPIERKQFDESILGSAIASFGVGELWILIARVWRLFVHPEQCAPLLSRSKWELDATSWVYLVAMILALIPFVVGSSLVMPHLYLYGPSFIMGFLGILMLFTLDVPINLPIGINSQPRSTKIRPFIYYAAEDVHPSIQQTLLWSQKVRYYILDFADADHNMFIAVDGLQDREFRVRYNERYESNKMFRRFFVNLTLWWLLGVVVYIGCVSAVIWTLEFHYAFGLSLGILFAYIAIWAAVTAIWTNIEMKREHRAYEAGQVDV